VTGRTVSRRERLKKVPLGVKKKRVLREVVRGMERTKARGEEDRDVSGGKLKPPQGGGGGGVWGWGGLTDPLGKVELLASPLGSPSGQAAPET